MSSLYGATHFLSVHHQPNQSVVLPSANHLDFTSNGMTNAANNNHNRSGANPQEDRSYQTLKIARSFQKNLVS